MIGWSVKERNRRNTFGESFSPRGGGRMKKRTAEIPRAAKNPMESAQTDPQGSYTGRPDDPAETPVQDADDL